ncbi:AAA family ATPase [Phaeodactylibacter xiamenensis]|uniref:ATP-binding protein n=1 Tax=Phaeodactylibacter xiamenensis TaxID=1524460 RepID=UPI003CCBD1BF
MEKLPIGIQDFGELRRGGYVYVDKTELIHRMVTMGKPYFLSRPRRFGKSLLVSTLKALFEGKRELFEGLWIENRWDWQQTNPVLHFSFEAIDYDKRGLEEALQLHLRMKAEAFNLKLERLGSKEQLAELIQKIAAKHGQVALLIDEYDKPITDYLNEENIGQAKANRDLLREFYGVLKSADEHLRLIFITGISKFAKVSIFSNLNNLSDLTLHRTYATLTGYTQSELEYYFEPHLYAAGQALELSTAVLLDKIREWYNGYSWDGRNKVYNPFGIISFLDQQAFMNFWSASGTPRLIVEQMRQQQLYAMEEVPIKSFIFEHFDLDHIALVPLLFQSGYLTVKSANLLTGEYVLHYPNKEVRESMYAFLLQELSPEPTRHNTGRTVHDLQQAFAQDNLEQVRDILDSVLADLPYETFDKTSEGLFHGLVHILFNYLGLYCKSEVHSARGRADAVVQMPQTIYIFEFKIHQTATEALQQIRERDYAQRFRSSGKRVLGIGVHFDGQERRIAGWEVEAL